MENTYMYMKFKIKHSKTKGPISTKLDTKHSCVKVFLVFKYIGQF